MTRTARKDRKKHLDSSSWTELSSTTLIKEQERDKKFESVDRSHKRKKDLLHDVSGQRIGKRKKKNQHLKLTMNDIPELSKETVSSKNEEDSTSRRTLELKNEKLKSSTHDKQLKPTNRRKKVRQVGKTKRNIQAKGTFEENVDDKRLKRREQRRIRRAKAKVCFNCRQPGHRLEECPNQEQETGLCFKCGSTEHSINRCKAKLPPGTFPFAKCFICGEDGHLSRSCPDNPRGLYPEGGCCSLCGSVEHLKANCPTKHNTSQSGETTVLDVTVSSSSADADSFNSSRPTPKKAHKSTSKIVKF